MRAKNLVLFIDFFFFFRIQSQKLYKLVKQTETKTLQLPNTILFSLEKPRHFNEIDEFCFVLFEQNQILWLVRQLLSWSS